MSYASKVGRARVSPSNPQALAVCNRCGIWYNRVDLRNQMEWRGAALLPTFVFVCNECYDVPQEQLRAIVVPPDPVPITLAFVEPFYADEVTYMGLAGTTTDPTTGLPIPNRTAMTTVAGTVMTPQPIGRPQGLDIDAVMPLALTNNVPVAYGVELAILSVISNDSDQITVTCSRPHGLSTNKQIAVEGLNNTLACGFYSVDVISATAFSYQVYAESVAADSLLTGSTRIVTCQVGVPLGWDTIPLTGSDTAAGNNTQTEYLLDFSRADDSMYVTLGVV